MVRTTNETGSKRDTLAILFVPGYYHTVFRKTIIPSFPLEQFNSNPIDPCKEGVSMTRSSRTITEAGLYHVVARGNNRQVLFHEPSDYESYAALILKMKGDYDFELYHYCLMSNHVHLLFHCGEAGILSKIMQRINLAYAKKFRKKRRYVGHVFQDRFKSFPIERDSYLLECGRYIER